MRLTCPNCGTQYEVDASAIPVAGRDVQCGSCSTTWFQPPEGVKLPPELERSGLRDWEEAETNQVPDLPGDAPEIDTAPNDEIVSEPELEELIETSSLVEQDVAPEPVVQAPEPTPPPAPAQIQSQEAEVPTEPTVEPESKRSAQAAVAAAAAGAALARNVAGVADDPSASAEQEPVEFETAASEIEEAPVEQVSQFVDDMLQEDLDRGVDDLERLDGIAGETSFETTETEVAPQVAPPPVPEVSIPEVEVPAPEIEVSPPDVEVSLPDVEAVIPEVEAAAPIIETVQDAPPTTVADAIRAAAEDLSPENKPGSPLPEDLRQERLSDYDEVARTDAPDVGDVEQIVAETVETAAPDLEEIAAEVETDVTAELETEASGYSTEELRSQVRSAMDTAIEDQSSKLVSGTFGEGSNPDLDDEIGVTETLAAKLKARVAEAAEAQAVNEPRTAQTGTLLAASATGIAAAAGQRVTEFPKRDTEDLSTSLRPKSLARSGLKPGLRPAATPEPKKSHFRSGFVLAILIFSILVMLYVFREPIGQMVPALADPLSSYGQAVDKIRLIIQDSVGQLIG